MTTVEFLCWASGGLVSKPEPPSDGRAAIYGLRRHRSLGRFLHRQANDPIAGTQEWLIDRAAELYGRDRERLAVQRTTLTWLDKTLRESGAGPVLLIKGMTHLFHTGLEHTTRRIGDLDLLAERPAAVVAALVSAGYTVSHRRMPHEFANLDAEERLPIDVHDHFPAWSYEQPVGGGTHDDPAVIVSQRIRYEDLVEHAVAMFPDDPACQIWAPGVTDCALISVAHMFHDYVEPPVEERFAKVRLGYVAETLELMESATFDRGEFDRAVQKFECQDALALFAECCRELLGVRVDELVTVPDPDRRTRPRSLSWGYVLDLNTATRDLVEQPPDLWRIVGGARSEPIRADGRTTYTTNAALPGVPFQQVWRTPKNSVDFSVTFTRTDDVFSVNLESPTIAGGLLEELRLVFGWHRFQVGYRHDADLVEDVFVGEEDRVEWTWSADRFRLRCDLSWQHLLPELSLADGRFPMLICATRFAGVPGSDWSEFLRDQVGSTVCFCAVGVDFGGG